MKKAMLVGILISSILLIGCSDCADWVYNVSEEEVCNSSYYRVDGINQTDMCIKNMIMGCKTKEGGIDYDDYGATTYFRHTYLKCTEEIEEINNTNLNLSCWKIKEILDYSLPISPLKIKTIKTCNYNGYGMVSNTVIGTWQEIYLERCIKK